MCARALRRRLCACLDGVLCVDAACSKFAGALYTRADRQQAHFGYWMLLFLADVLTWVFRRYWWYTVLLLEACLDSLLPGGSAKNWRQDSVRSEIKICVAGCYEGNALDGISVGTLGRSGSVSTCPSMANPILMRYRLHNCITCVSAVKGARIETSFWRRGGSRQFSRWPGFEHSTIVYKSVIVRLGDYRSLYDCKLRRMEMQRMKLAEKLRRMKRKEQISKERTKAKVNCSICTRECHCIL